MSNKTSDNNVATEEDIKVLKNIEKLRRIEFKHCVTDREERAIANILSDYTRQKQINEEHQKINGELRERVKELDTENNKLLKELYNAHCIISDLSNFKGGITMLSEEEKKAIEYFYNLRSTIDESYMLFDEEINVKCGKDMIKQITLVFNLITKLQKENEEKDKQIDLMAEFISKYHCFEVTVYDLDDECKHEHECKDCIKQYFAKLTKKGVEYENNNKERRTRN